MIDLDDIGDFGGADLGPQPRGPGPEWGLIVASRAKTPAMNNGFDELIEEERIYQRQGDFMPIFTEIDDDTGEEKIIPHREDVRRQ